MEKKTRAQLLVELTERLEGMQRWDHMNIVLQTYEVPAVSGDQFDPSVSDVICEATDEQLLGLADYFGVEVPGAVPVAPLAAPAALMETDTPLFLFASHLSSQRVLVHAVGDELARYGIELFVAHDSIEPDSSWHDEIVGALDRCDGGIAFLHQGFRESQWCDQEVGWLLGRHVPVLSLKFDLAPYGPLGKHQAQTARNLSAEAIAIQLLERIAAKPTFRTHLGRSLVNAMAKSPNFRTTDAIWKHLREFDDLTASQFFALIAAANNNNQVYKANSPHDGGRPYAEVIEEFVNGLPKATGAAS
ncbi:toll/interleukin-1 receptor domain-containing protein [Tsukamurella soli]|uniref:TIR domain-containing protein n=1 Tax=Tsukamurella soli TaxID=644556 RepID=A0ABP8K6U3_9ACTN